MKIPQLFLKVGQNRYCPVTSPMNSKPLYFWDDTVSQIVPAEDKLKIHVVEGVAYFVEDDGLNSRV